MSQLSLTNFKEKINKNILRSKYSKRTMKSESKIESPYDMSRAIHIACQLSILYVLAGNIKYRKMMSIKTYSLNDPLLV